MGLGIDGTKEMPKAWVPHGNGVWKQVLDFEPINYSMTMRWSTLLDGQTQVLKTDQLADDAMHAEFRWWLG